MVERELEMMFRDFLMIKGYSRENLLLQFAVSNDIGASVYRPDLVIIDLERNEYLGLVEFKNRVDYDIIQKAIAQFYQGFSYLGVRNLPAYLVVPGVDDDFQIFELTESHHLQPISKESFPDYRTLSAKRSTEKKVEEREVAMKRLAELEAKKRKAKTSSILSLLSIVLGVAAAVTSIFFQQKSTFRLPVQPVICCDSLETKYQNLVDRLDTLENQISTKEITRDTVSKDTVYVISNLNLLEKRVATIETGISASPERTLSLLRIRQEIEMLKKADEFAKELTQSKIDVLQKEIDVQNAWMLGVLIAIFGTIFSFVIPNLLSRRNESSVQTDRGNL